MKKTEYEDGYKYVYTYKKDGMLLKVRFYGCRLFKLLSSYEGEYDFLYDGNKLISQRNIIKNIGLTEAVNYFYDDKGRLSKKEYYNNKMALRYTMLVNYDNEGPCRMEVKRFNGQLVLDTCDKYAVNDYVSKTGKKIDFLSDMLELAASLAKNPS